MAEISESKTSPGPANANITPRVQPKALVQEYLLEHLPIYRELCELQRQASTNQLLYAPGSPFRTPSPTN